MPLGLIKPLLLHLAALLASACLGVAMDSKAAETPDRPRRSPSLISVGTETTIAATPDSKPVRTDAMASDVKITHIHLAQGAARALMPFPPKKAADEVENEAEDSLSSLMPFAPKKAADEVENEAEDGLSSAYSSPAASAAPSRAHWSALDTPMRNELGIPTSPPRSMWSLTPKRGEIVTARLREEAVTPKQSGLSGVRASPSSAPSRAHWSALDTPMRNELGIPKTPPARSRSRSRE